MFLWETEATTLNTGQSKRETRGKPFVDICGHRKTLRHMTTCGFTFLSLWFKPQRMSI